jgi:hypothetical protein
MPPFGESPMLGVIVALAALQALVVVYMVVHARQDGGWDDPDSGAVTAGRTTDSDVVVCRHCGAENDAGYTFCRRCVNELLDAAAGGGEVPSVRSGPS